MRPSLHSWVFVAVGAVITSSAMAAPRHHGAHVHGEAILDVAVDGHHLDLHLDAPGASITGFEHPPVDVREKSAFANAVGVLRNASRWLTPTAAAGCTGKPAAVESHGFELAPPVSANTTKSAPAAGGETEHEHSDFDVDVSFTCTHPEKLTTIYTDLFKQFPVLHKLIVNLALPTGQGRQELLPSSPTIQMSQ